METYRYRVQYLEDLASGESTHFDSPSPVEVGDLIRVESGFFHYQVLEIAEASSPEPLLRLGKSGQGPLDATQQTLHGR